jgi:hypothetical protein
VKGGISSTAVINNGGGYQGIVDQERGLMQEAARNAGIHSCTS